KAISGEIAARPLSTRDRAARVTPSCAAASVTVRPRAGRTSSRSVSPGCGGLNIVVMVLPSVIVLVIHQNRVAVIKAERQTPVAIHENRVMAGQTMRVKAQLTGRQGSPRRTVRRCARAHGRRLRGLRGG